MTELQQELKAVLDPALAEVKAAREEVAKDKRETLEQIADVRKQLLHQQERDTAPGDTKVRDLEAKLADLEAQVNDANERVRAAETRLITPAADAKRSVFEDVFIRDVPRVIEAMQARDGFERALTSGTTLASYGKLNADQENQFLDWLISKQVALGRVTVRRMSSPTAYLDELVTANRKLRAAQEGTAPSVSDAFTTARRTLTSKETIWAEDVTLSFIEDNIERGNINDHIAMNLATAFGNDHNDLFWNGDEDNSDDFLGINDGIIDIAKADGSVVDYDATSDTTVQAILKGAHKLYAYDYAARPDLNPVFFVPYKTTIEYADEIADRKTVLADRVLVEGLSALRYFGIPIVAEPHLASDEAVLTPTQNLVWGVQRGVTLESEWNPRKRQVEYTVTARVDTNYAKSGALVLIDNIAATLR